jgi:hypothetical protein
MKTTFKPTSTDGVESVMDTTELNVNEIRFNRESRQITLTIESVEDFSSLSWQEVKKRVLANGGTWTNKADGIEFLTK